MVLIPSGEIRVGIEPREIESLLLRYSLTRRQFFESASPSFDVRVDSFYLDRAEVTNRDFADFLEGNTGWRIDEIGDELHNGDYLSHWDSGRVPSALAEQPVTFVTWHAALAYGASKGGRLPTEVEWEYAASSGGNRDYPWGNQEPTEERANYSASGLGAPTDVASYPGSSEDLYDLAGNVWEYCADSWRDKYDVGQAATPADVQGWIRARSFLEFGDRRVIRGASFGGAAFQLRADFRDSHPVDGAVAHVGFRCAQSAGAVDTPD